MLRFKFLSLAAVIVMMALSMRGTESAQSTSSRGTAMCDCKPEFNATAEGPGTCQVAKDNTRWCKIKFNSGTAAGTARQEEFREAMRKLDLPPYDNVVAAQQINAVSPDRWTANFVQTNLPPLIAVALWDAAPNKIKGVNDLISSKAQSILRGFQMPPPGTEFLELGPYKVIVSWGCIEMVDRQFSITIKTSYSNAPRGCAYR